MKIQITFCSSFAHLSTAITVGERVKTSDPSEFQKHFPQFIWLLRDVINPPCDKDGKDIPLNDYVNEEVLKTIQIATML